MTIRPPSSEIYEIQIQHLQKSIQQDDADWLTLYNTLPEKFAEILKIHKEIPTLSGEQAIGLKNILVAKATQVRTIQADIQFLQKRVQESIQKLSAIHTQWARGIIERVKLSNL